MIVKTNNIILPIEMNDKNNAEIMTEESLQAFFTTGEMPEAVKPKEEEAAPIETLESFFSDAPVKTVPEIVPSEAPSTVPSNNNFYNDLVKEYLADGDWEDVAIELEEGQEPISISDMGEITPERFRELRGIQKQLKEEKIQEDYISVKGLDESTLKMIELKKAGGDITSLLKIESELVHPLKGLDLDNESVQEHLVRQKLNFKGLNPKTVEAEIRRLKEDLELDLEAKKVVDEINTNFEGIVKQKTEEQIAYNTQAQEEQKEFKKKMTNTFKSFALKESLVKSLTELTSVYDENGLSETDKMFFAAKENPELFAEVAFLLKDKEAYQEYKGVKIKNEVTKDAVKKIFRMAPKTSSTAAATTVDPREQFFKQT